MDPTSEQTPIVEARGISKRFGSTVALRDAKIAVQPGEVHALVGRNGAGKSTLVSILTGLQRPDTGSVRFSGEPAPPLDDRAAWQRRVACVYQKSTVIPALSVAENLFLNRQPVSDRGLISWRTLLNEAEQLLQRWGVAIDPRRTADELTVEGRQLVEIARALSFGARFIILDEPTAQLDGAAIARLFRQIDDLRQAGVTFLFISHHLQEIFELCQTVTVFRDARWVTTAPVASLTRGELVDAMTGDQSGLSSVDPTGRAPLADAPTLLELDALCGPGYTDVSLTVRAGEVVGLAGTSASGKDAVAAAVAGLHKPTSGRITVDGTALRPGDVRASLRSGVGFVPRDRHEQGLVPELSVGENATLTITDRLGPRGIMAPGRLRSLAEAAIRRLGIVTAGPAQPVSALSGGNQQKVVMARALANEPRVLVLVNPTAGVDVKSKEALLHVVDRACDDSKAVLVVSDELDDLRRCARVLVVRHGRVTEEHPAGWSDSDLVAAIEGVNDRVA